MASTPRPAPARMARRAATPDVQAGTSSGRSLLGHRAEWPGGNVMDPKAGLDVDGGRAVFAVGPGEDLAGHPGASQGGAQLPDVHVHSAAIAGARLGQGRGVHREDRDRWHQALPESVMARSVMARSVRAESVVGVTTAAGAAAGAAGEVAAAAAAFSRQKDR